MDELKDVYNHFLLYYGRDIPKMQNAAKAARKKQKRIREDGEEEEGLSPNLISLLIPGWFKILVQKSSKKVCWKAFVCAQTISAVPFCLRLVPGLPNISKNA